MKNFFINAQEIYFLTEKTCFLNYLNNINATNMTKIFKYSAGKFIKFAGIKTVYRKH